VCDYDPSCSALEVGGAQRAEGVPGLAQADTRGREGGELEARIRIKDYLSYFRLCKSCLQICLEKGLVQARKGTPLSYEVVTRDRVLRDAIYELITSASWIEFDVLYKLDAEARKFLGEVDIGPKGPGQYSFDYVCVDDQGGKYLVDVTSVRGLDTSPAPLSKKERLIAEHAREAGFKILIPVVRFLHNWRFSWSLWRRSCLRHFLPAARLSHS